MDTTRPDPAACNDDDDGALEPGSVVGRYQILHALGAGAMGGKRIVEALQACAGNQTRAARQLGMSRATLGHKLALYRIPRPRK
jgi:two-component system, NtrC family, response regulator AtoC